MKKNIILLIFSCLLMPNAWADSFVIGNLEYTPLLNRDTIIDGTPTQLLRLVKHTPQLINQQVPLLFLKPLNTNMLLIVLLQLKIIQMINLTQVDFMDVLKLHLFHFQKVYNVLDIKLLHKIPT